MEGQPEKRHIVRAQQQDAVPDWLNPLPLGIMSASAYIYIIKEKLETLSGMESYLPTSDRHAASWIFSDGPSKQLGVVKLRYNPLNFFFIMSLKLCARWNHTCKSEGGSCLKKNRPSHPRGVEVGILGGQKIKTPVNVMNCREK